MFQEFIVASFTDSSFIMLKHCQRLNLTSDKNLMCTSDTSVTKLYWLIIPVLLPYCPLGCRIGSMVTNTTSE